MKRLRPLPLLQAVLPDIYCIDSSAWFNIDRRADSGDVWVMISALIERGRIVACASVLTELRGDPIYQTRIKPYEAALQFGDCGPEDVAHLMRVGQITYDYPAMSKATGLKTPADPYVIALALHHGYVVVADESLKRANRKISGVCQKLGIRCLTLSEFVAELNSAKRKGQDLHWVSTPK